MWKLAEDTITRDDMLALSDWLRTFPRLTQGELVRRFEEAWSQWLGTRHSVMVTSGTAANFVVASIAGGLVEHHPPRVGVAAVTWPTNVTPSLMLGHSVTVFDIDRRTLGLDSGQVCEAMERGDVDILFVTHLLGLDALTDEMVKVAERNGVLLVEDCCEAHGARFGADRVGNSGLASTFSFYFGHHMSTIEGGMVSTADEEFADRARLLRAHGLARESSRFGGYLARYPDLDPRFLFVAQGLNFRSTELNAFLGLRQLDYLDDRIEKRNENMEMFLAGLPTWLWRDFETEGMSSFALPLIAVDSDHAALARRVVDELGIESRPVVAGNLLRQPFLRDGGVRVTAGGTPVADHVHSCGVYVGNGPHVTPEMVEILTSRLTEAGRS